MAEEGFCIFLFGMGRVGYSLLQNFLKAGIEVAGVWNRTPIPRLFNTPYGKGSFVESGSIPETLKNADTILIAISDRAVAPFAMELSLCPDDLSGRVVFHTSGALSSSILDPLKGRGAECGSFHPLLAFGSPPPGFHSMEGASVILEGDRAAVKRGARIARALGAKPVEISSKDKPLYHCAAVLSSNLLQGLLLASMSMMERAGLPVEEALPGLLRLAGSVLECMKGSGPVDSLTGPLSRGDLETVSLHLLELEARFPELLPLYRELSLFLIREMEERRGKGGIFERAKEVLERRG